MKVFRKKPVKVHAFRWDGKKKTLLKNVPDPSDRRDVFYESKLLNGKFQLQINSMEGLEDCKVGDYIIKGVDGEFYCCDPKIFAQTYENVHNNFKKQGKLF